MIAVTTVKDNTVINIELFAEKNERDAWRYFFSEMRDNGGEIVDGVHEAHVIDQQEWESNDETCHIQLHRLGVSA